MTNSNKKDNVLELNVRSLFEFVYDENTNTVYANRTSEYDKLYKDFIKKADYFHKETLLNICSMVAIHTYEKYNYYKEELGYEILKHHEDLEFVLDYLLMKKEYELLIHNLKIFNHLNIKKIEDAIIATNDIKLIAILGVYAINFETRCYLENVILSSKDYANIYFYGVMRKDNPYMEILNVLMDDVNGENHEYVYNLTKLYHNHASFNLRKVTRYFAKNHHYRKLESLYLDLLGKTYDEFIEYFIEITNGWELCNYAIYSHQKLNDINLKKIEDQLIECREPNILCTFASKVPNCDLNRIQEEIIKSKRSKYMYEFAKNVKSSNRARLLEEIVKQGDLVYIYKFENNINNIVREDIMKEILEIGDPKMICALASELSAKYLRACEQVLKKANDSEYLEYFYQNNGNRM